MSATIDAHVVENRAEKLMHELAQCREDERASKAQIFQLLSTTATFLTIVTTVSSAIGSSDDSSKWELHLFLYFLTILVVAATVAYVANLGFLSTFRHHYMVDLESQLSDDGLACENGSEKLLHWETVSKPFITMNPKHIGSGSFRLFSINATIALGSVLVLALVFLIMQMHIILVQFPELAVATWFGLILYVLTLLICAITLVVSMYKSKEIFEQSYEKAKKHEFDQLNHKGGAIFYYLYPRIKDVQKVLFIVLGYVTGLALQCWTNGIMPSMFEIIRDMAITVFIIDVLVYQARYLWNDIRGAREDRNHPSAASRKRLPTHSLGFETAVYIAEVVMLLRFIATPICIFLLAPSKWLQLSIACVLILGLGAAYETARAGGKAKLTIFLVCFGYPLRWGAGLWSAFPSVSHLLWQKVEVFSSVLLLLISVGAFGGVFVTMTWVLEAAHIFQQSKRESERESESEKPHLRFLFGKLPESQKSESFPLIQQNRFDNLKECLRRLYPWNLFYLIATVCLLLSVFCLTTDRFKHLVSVLTFVLCLIPMVAHNCGKRGFAAIGISLILLLVFALLNPNPTVETGLFLLIEILQCVYLCVYVSFRCSNYTVLYSMMENLLKTLRECAKMFFTGVQSFLLGRDTLEELTKEREDKR